MTSTIRVKPKRSTDPVHEYAKNTYLKKDKDQLFKFLEQFVKSIPSDCLMHPKDIQEWYHLVVSQWQFMQINPNNKIKLRVFTPTKDEDDFELSCSLIELIMPDMPFLVDSMRLLLQSMGINIMHMSYMGGIWITRDKKGQLNDCITRNDKQRFSQRKCSCIEEAPIQIQIDKQNSIECLQEIEQALFKVLNDVLLVNSDWHVMTDVLEGIISDLRTPMQGVSQNELRESRAFLQWLLKNHLTLLGIREYRVINSDERHGFELIPDSSLGVLRNISKSSHFRSFSDLPIQALETTASVAPVIQLGKTNTKATVHRPEYTDFINIKRYKKGQVVGMYRIVGLYTSLAYRALPEHVPFLRRKIRQVLQQSTFSPNSHAGKDLLHILHTFPRDDLFHAGADELFEITKGIMTLQERHCIRLFARLDQFGRFVSCLVFVPRENFTAELAESMRTVVSQMLEANEVTMETYFSSSVLVRIHFVAHIKAGAGQQLNFNALEQALIDTGLSWQDSLESSLKRKYLEPEALALKQKYRRAFGAGYRDRFSPSQAVKDIESISCLSDETKLMIKLYIDGVQQAGHVRMKLFRNNRPLSLSEVVPLLENMGFSVLREDSYLISLADGENCWISDFSLAGSEIIQSMGSKQLNKLCADAFYQVWQNNIDNDSFNRLIMDAGIDWRKILILRAYGKYIQQINVPYSIASIEKTLYSYPKIAQKLIEFFDVRFNPDYKGLRDDSLDEIEKEINRLLEDVASLDQDSMIRLYLQLMQATTRTNYFQSHRSEELIVLKLHPEMIPNVPKPVPLIEIFVYSSRFEGVHLRAAKVARGGLRWSDRQEDYRTEVLGLMKAQQVKNSVIVPAGAKGGFVAKRLHKGMSRDEFSAEGVTCYKKFIRGLLDVVDNLEGDTVKVQPGIVRYDDDDSYLVVAADKGTATFSDIANSISLQAGFWLGDAFASGGSVGYDHKKIGITARGAWVSAQRHFLMLDKNLTKDVITVVGIGDMSGDVFGNGMLLSDNLKLVAAFNHQHIFFDPDPNPKDSFAERERLFKLPRSSWEDYNEALISKGGGVFRRDAKFIVLSEQMQSLLATEKATMNPGELIQAILMMKVDMLWNGGIGTYIKSQAESHSAVGDRSNDLLRVNANELNCRVICEGGNLGITQLGRVEYELSGGEINTDFIDNSAGVDCSDHEVNIKILLSQLIESKLLPAPDREALMSEMEEDVARLVLLNNYRQNQTLNLAAAKSYSHLGLYIALIKYLENNAGLDRKLESLPTTKELLARKADKRGLTKPELAIIFATVKNMLKEQILQTDVVDNPDAQDFLYQAFPDVLRQRFPGAISRHRLRKEIIATQISNTLVSDMGIAFVFQMIEETKASIATIVKAYIITRKVFSLGNAFLKVAALDHQVSVAVQNQIMLEGVRLARQAIRWFLAQDNREQLCISESISLYQEPVEILFSRIGRLLEGNDKEAFESYKRKLMNRGVPDALAVEVASGRSMFHTLNIVQSALHSNSDLYRVSKVYFAVFNRLYMGGLRKYINEYPSDSSWAVLAKSASNADLDRVQRSIVVDILTNKSLSGSVPVRVDAWCEQHDDIINDYTTMLGQMRNLGVPDFAIVSVIIRLLLKLKPEK